MKKVHIDKCLFVFWFSSFQGRSTDTLTVNIPMDFILKKGDSPLVMQKEGKGSIVDHTSLFVCLFACLFVCLFI
jgi:hypothetical protein